MSSELCCCLARGTMHSKASWTGGRPSAPRALEHMPGKGGIQDPGWEKGGAPRA